VSDIDEIGRDLARLYRELLEISRRMLSALNAEEGVPDIQELLNDREAVIASIKANDERLKVAGLEYTDDFDLLSEIDSLLEEITEIDKKCSEILEKNKTDISREMKDLRTGGKAIKGYNRRREEGKGGFGRFIDLKK